MTDELEVPSMDGSTKQSLRAELAGARQEAAAAKRELAVARAALAAAMENASGLQERAESAERDLVNVREHLVLARGEAEMAENDLTEAQSQLRVMGVAVRGSEEGREASVAIAVVMREQLENWVTGGMPVKDTERVLTATAELADAFVQSVRDRWERQVVEALRGGATPDATVSKEFADAWGELVDRAQSAAVDEALAGVREGLLERLAGEHSGDDEIGQALTQRDSRQRAEIGRELLALVEHVFTVRRRFASGAADAAEVSIATQLVFDAIATLGAPA